MNIYIGNLPLTTTEDDLRRVFAGYGEVISVIIMNDAYIGSGQPRSYGYVQMPLKADGVHAIASLEGTMMGGRAISIVEALPLAQENRITPVHSGRQNRPGRTRAR